MGKDLEVGGHDIFQGRLLPSYLFGRNEKSHTKVKSVYSVIKLRFEPGTFRI
jgi:hypothetical protein